MMEEALDAFKDARAAVRKVTMSEVAEIKSLARPPPIVPKVELLLQKQCCTLPTFWALASGVKTGESVGGKGERKKKKKEKKKKRKKKNCAFVIIC